MFEFPDNQHPARREDGQPQGYTKIQFKESS